MPWGSVVLEGVVSEKVGRNEIKGRGGRQVLHDKQAILHSETEGREAMISLFLLTGLDLKA